MSDSLQAHGLQAHGLMPGSSVCEIFQARILEWVAISSSRGLTWPRDQTCISCVSCIADGLFTTEPPGKPFQSSQNGQHQKIRLTTILYLQIKHAGQGVEKRKSSYTVGRNVNWWNHYEKQYGISSEN